MNGIRGDPLTQLHCQRLPMTTGTHGEPGASCDAVGRMPTLVEQGCDLNDQRHIPLGLSLLRPYERSAGKNLRGENLRYTRRARKLSGNGRSHCLRATITGFAARTFKGKPPGVTERGQGDWISISFYHHKLSLA